MSAKTTLSFRLAATSDGSGGMLAIRDSDGSPPGAVLRHTDGDPAGATYTWKPPVSQIGVHRVTFSVSSGAGDATRTLVIRVGRANRPPPGHSNPAGVYPQRALLSDRGSESYRWAFVRHRTVARTGPSALGPRDHADHVSDARALPQRDPGPRPGDVQGREDVGSDPARSPAEQYDRLGAPRRPGPLPEGAHAHGDRAAVTESHALQARPARLLGADRRRAGAHADAARRVLRAREALRATTRPCTARARSGSTRGRTR